MPLRTDQLGPARRVQGQGFRRWQSYVSKASLLGLIGCISLVHSHGGQMTSAGSLYLRVIVVDSSSEAQQILEQLKKGESFAVLARKKSIDPSAAEGGYLGRVNPTSLTPRLGEALEGVRPGETTGIIKIANGYAIFEVVPEEDIPVGQGMGVNRDLPLSAKGNVRYPADVAGQVIADLAFRDFPKPQGWQQDLGLICRIRKESLAGLEERLQKRLQREDQPQSQTLAPDLIETHYALAQVSAYQGNMQKAIEQWEAAYRIAAAEVPAGIVRLDEVLGIAYLHKAEMDNGIYQDPGPRCIFPPPRSSPYLNTSDSKKAVAHFLKYLERRPDELQVEWLLNLAYLTMGQYPAGVPPKYLIPPAAFESSENIGRFVDVAKQTGLNVFSMANGLIVDDFDNDGLLDVVTSSYDFCEPMHLFHNNGNGTFADRSGQAGLADQLGGLNMIQADYNNDGCLDILVLRGAWEFPVRKSLLRNNCDGTFTDVTRQAGLTEPATRTQTAVWADIDNDGFADLFVGNENGPSQLFRNRGDGTFEDISHSSGIDRIAFTKAVVAADYDHDGYPDFYVANLYGGNFLYHNNHNRTFSEVAHEAGVDAPQSQTFAAWFFDYDNDGWPDIFATSYFFSIEETLRSYLHLAPNVETLKLYRNLGNGTFRDVTSQVGLDKVTVPMGANFGDVDNDGYLDIYLATGGPEYGAMVPNMLLRNQAGKSFVDITASSGTGELHKGHGTSFADLGNNGQQDILTGAGGAVPGDAHRLRVFANPGHENDWINVKLVGVKTNRAAIGAGIKLTVENEGHVKRDIYRTVSSGGSFGASPLAQSIGLGHLARIVNLEIEWPTSHTRQNFSGVAKNQFIEISEFAKTYRQLKRKSFSLPGAKQTLELGPRQQP